MIRPSSTARNSFFATKISGILPIAGWLIVLAVMLLPSPVDRATAQGLSGPPKRLEETLGKKVGLTDSEDTESPDSGDMESSDDGDTETYDEAMEREMMEGMEGMEEGYYDDYGGSSRRASGTPQSDAIQTYASSLSGLMGSLDLSPLFDSGEEITVDSGPVLHREAEQAFLAGDQGLALELVFGHMTTEYREAVDDLQAVKYSALLRRPVWNIRWGVSMYARGGEGLADLKPIRAGATPSRQGFPSSGDGSGEDYEAQMEQQEMEQQMEMDMEMDMEMEQGMSDSRRAPSKPTAPAMPVRKMLSDEANETLDKTLGLVATVLADEFNKRFQNGDFGTLFSSVTVPEAVESDRRGNGSPTAAPAHWSMSEGLADALSGVQPIEMWKPGLVYLGEGTSDEIIAKARAANLDLLLHFDAVLKPGRNEAVQNISRCRLLNVTTGKSMGVSKGMDNMEAQRMAEARGKDERAHVDEQFSNLLAIIDRQAKVADLPTLSPEVARKRIASLMSGPRARTLRTLAEVRLYQLQGLIDESEVEAIFDIVGGAEGLMLLHGPREERMAMARKWAVESQASIAEQ